MTRGAGGRLARHEVRDLALTRSPNPKPQALTLTLALPLPLTLTLTPTPTLTLTRTLTRYEISEEDYLKRDDNFRKWKAEKLAEDPTWTFSKQVKRQQDAKRKEKDPNFVPEPEKQPITDDEHMADLAAAIKVAVRGVGVG